MSASMVVSTACYGLFAFLMLIYGVVYVTRREFLPYHNVALGAQWHELDHPLRVLIIALIRLGGGGVVGTAISIGCMLVFAFIDGADWARWAIPATGLAVAIPMVYGVYCVRRDTPGTPPLMGAIFLTALIPVGLVASLL